MVTYEINAAGPQGFQVTAVTPGNQRTIIGDFSTLLDAEAFAINMRALDAGVTSRSATKGVC